MTDERFTELLTKFLAEEISPDENTELEQAMLVNESFRERYNYFKSYWKKDESPEGNSKQLFDKIRLRIETETVNETESEIEPEYQPVILENLSKYSFNYWRQIAAALVFVTACTGLYQYVSKNKTNAGAQDASLQVKQAPARSKSTIILTDGTKVILNSASELKYPLSFNGKTRDVYLTGEAFFDVHKDHQHPFIVHTNKMNVRVLGTAFDVKSYSNDRSSETTLIRGMIEVTLADRPSDRIILKPKEKLIVQKDLPAYRIEKSLKQAARDTGTNVKYTLTSLTYFKNHDTTVVETSWLNDRFIFKDEDFGTLSNRMERWYGVSIKLNNDDLKKYHFTGIFKHESIKEALDVLRLTEAFHYKMNGTAINIY
jgi:transmembrane sensor